MASRSGAALVSDAALRKRLLAAVAERVIAHAEELTALNSAIGDGDHGHNMKRGFEAVAASIDAFAEMNLPEMLRAVGMKLVSTVGGASGPLYGTLFMALGKALPDKPNPRRRRGGVRAGHRRGQGARQERRRAEDDARRPGARASGV